MSSIGIVMRADGEAGSLGSDWTPEPLGPRSDVLAVVSKYFPGNDESLALELNVEPAEKSEWPRTITASGVWGDREIQILLSICDALGARFHDAEAGDFIDLSS